MRDGFHHLECEPIGEGVVVRGEHRSAVPDEIRIKAYPSGDGSMVVLNEVRMGSIPMTAATGRALAAAIVAACEKVEERVGALPSGHRRLADEAAQDVRAIAEIARPSGGNWMGG